MPPQERNADEYISDTGTQAGKLSILRKDTGHNRCLAVLYRIMGSSECCLFELPRSTAHADSAGQNCRAARRSTGKISALEAIVICANFNRRKRTPGPCCNPGENHASAICVACGHAFCRCCIDAHNCERHRYDRRFGEWLVRQIFGLRRDLYRPGWQRGWH